MGAAATCSERDSIPHRVEGLEVMLELLPARVERVLDLGTGDGNTLALVLAARPEREWRRPRFPGEHAATGARTLRR